MKNDVFRDQHAQETGPYIFPDGSEAHLQEVPYRIYEHYIDEIVIPVVHHNQQIGKEAALRMEEAEHVLTRRHLNPIVLAVHGKHFLEDGSAQPQIPPPAIKHMTGEGTVYELIDEQHAGMAYFAVHEHLSVYVVETVTYDQ